jgi:hypothetical protein
MLHSPYIDPNPQNVSFEGITSFPEEHHPTEEALNGKVEGM